MSNKEQKDIETNDSGNPVHGLVIKPCPFCGKTPEPVSRFIGTRQEQHWVSHAEFPDGCVIMLTVTATYKTLRDAIEAWNTRAL